MSNLKIIRLNQIYRQLNQQEYPHWLITQEHELFSPLTTIGIGTYQPTETQIRKYHLVRQEFRLDFFDSTASLSALSLPEITIPKESVTIYTDEAVALGINLLRLKKILGIEPKETNFELIYQKSPQSLIKSHLINQQYLDLRIGSYLIKFRYGLNQNQQVVLLYPTKYNNQTIDRFESANVWLQQLNSKYLNKCLAYSQFITVKNHHQSPKIYGLKFKENPNQAHSQENIQDFSSAETAASNTTRLQAEVRVKENQNNLDPSHNQSLSDKSKSSTDSLVPSPLNQRVKQSAKNLLHSWMAQLRNFFNAQDFKGSDFSNWDLAGGNFSGCDFSGADLSGSNLYVADFSHTNLTGANLSRADLSYADFSGANLTGANLSGADLTQTNLSQAILRGANVTQTNLSGAILNQNTASEADLSNPNLKGNLRFS